LVRDSSILFLFASNVRCIHMHQCMASKPEAQSCRSYKNHRPPPEATATPRTCHQLHNQIVTTDHDQMGPVCNCQPLSQSSYQQWPKKQTPLFAPRMILLAIYKLCVIQIRVACLYAQQHWRVGWLTSRDGKRHQRHQHTWQRASGYHAN
jgi:hypothetical protein